MSTITRPLAVITGASSGIGAEFTRRLAVRGYDLLLVARREDRLQSLAAQLNANTPGIHVDILVADLITDAGRDRVAHAIRHAPNLGLLINNAGFGSAGLFHVRDLDEHMRLHHLHVLTTLALTHAALNNLLAATPSPPATPSSPHAATIGSGPAPAFPRISGIINVASIASFGQSASNVAYCATKAWMASFTEGIAMELASQRSSVCIQALCPGFTYSEFHDVLKVDRRSVPKAFWMSAQFVVSESLKGLDRGRLFVIPGWRYRCIALLMRLAPGGLMRRASTLLARYRRSRIANPAAN